MFWRNIVLIIILCFEDSWDRGVRIFVLCSFSALLSKVCVAGRLGDAKITSQDEYKALAYSSGHVEFHRLSPDDSAQCLDSGHCSRESWCWIWQRNRDLWVQQKPRKLYWHPLPAALASSRCGLHTINISWKRHHWFIHYISQQITNCNIWKCV